MLPSVLADELKGAVRQFLKDAFPIANPYFQGAQTGEPQHATALVDDLVQREGALFKGPYLDVRLPYRTTAAPTPFQHIKLPFEPFKHQHLAFQRLAGDQPRSTIIATGTGSGKTECFMLPVLEDALRRRQPGIKTIIIYPMNALAADQARRFASEVSKLKTKLTVGMYVGGTRDAALTRHMDEQHVITDRDALRENPPDILLTNYKMLDFLLIRPEDKPLWRHNQPGTLKYLIVDELHTFDGAQGTDLACLIRRLRDRLQAGPELACVGTSATMGSRGSDELLEYAGSVFAAQFDEGALIREDRLSVDEYLSSENSHAVAYTHRPNADDPRLDPNNHASAAQYVREQAALWFPDADADELNDLTGEDQRAANASAVRLGTLLRQHQDFHQLLHATTALTDTTTLAAEWARRFYTADTKLAERLLISLVSLIAAARIQMGSGDSGRLTVAPLLHVREQLWLRELRRMVCSVPLEEGEPPRLAFADDLTGPHQPLHLPLVHCRECHLAGWGATTNLGSPQLSNSLQEFYQAWFQHTTRALLLVPLTGERSREHASRFCPHCHRLQAGAGDAACANCGKTTVRVWVPEMTKKVERRGATTTVRDDRCPNCLAPDSLTIVGYRAATLISVMTGRLFGTPYNDDRKLIAFSDSVQDAAHRAGFLGANSWRALTRQALARWLKQHGPTTLTELRECLPAYWKAHLGSAERFAGTFAAPDMMWLRDYRQLEQTGKLPSKSDLPSMVSKRLAWECVNEFGQRAAIGRSLERTNSAAVGFDAAQLFKDTQGLAARLREELEPLRDMADEALQRFVTGWLHHVRTRGAIHAHELDGYISTGGTEFMFTRIPWMPGFGRGKRPPAAVSLTHTSNNFETLIGGQNQNWYQDWLNKTLGQHHPFIATEERQVYGLLLSTLHAAGWLTEHYLPRQGESVYLIDPGKLLITTDVAVAKCDACRHQLHFAGSLADAYDGMPCLRSHCDGRLHAEAAPAPTAGYGHTEPHRLVPHEHTGLLERELRERVEASFTQGGEPWDYNLLSATPTLEMGIDIGALSTVFLCSVPPTQANYVQRVGRAGRRDGNSLAVTVANGRNHDLFFYADPSEMLAGDVATPGVFLRAQAVLERQLVAYCFDRWTATAAEPGAIPSKLRQVLNAVEHAQEDRFPYTLFRYVNATKDELLARFRGMFTELGDDARAYLGEYLERSSQRSLEGHLLRRLHELSRERKALRRQVDQLKRKIAQQEENPQDEARDELIKAMHDERTALLGLMSSLNDQATLNFLTDEGVLPNYAFPEEGVTLQSVILRSRASTDGAGDGQRYEKATYKFQRSAQAALGELAPEATFYAVSHKLNIDRVDLSLTEPQQWRFCDRCHHSENVTLSDVHSACPRCGSAQWANVGQKHEVLKLRQVYSTESDRRSRIGDDSEQRDPLFFNRQMLVEIPPGGQSGGWRLTSESLPFGFEYLQKAVLREVNFGLAGGEKNVFTVAGDERPRRGFRLCRHCGTVQIARPKRGEKLHTFTCALYDDPNRATDDDFLDSLYLYRELESEAIRVLLPLSEVAYSETELNSFVAALNLGLKLHYRGDVHHLQVTQMKEPATHESGERVFLVIYDRIPGGTGYLKDLMRDPANLFDVLQRAHAHLRGCVCAEDGERDGCYRCLLAYRDSRHMPSISRTAATKLLARILAERDAIERIDNLSSVSTNPLVESVLEQRFLDTLGKLRGAQLSRETYRGKPGNLLTMPGADGRPVAWHVEHQAHLGPSDGVAVDTAVDVLLTPARDSDTAKPIAVYMDGWQYHRGIIRHDVRKRRALLASGNYWVVTLTWEDLPVGDGTVMAVANDLMAVEGPHRGLLGQACPVPELRIGSSMQLVDAWLRSPSLPQGGGLALALRYTFTLLRNLGNGNAAMRAALVAELRAVTPPEILNELAITSAATMVGGHSASLTGARGLAGFVVTLPETELQRALTARDAGLVTERLRCHLWLDDDQDGPADEFSDHLKIHWRAFWVAANHLQFLPGFSLASRRAVSASDLPPLSTPTGGASGPGSGSGAGSGAGFGAPDMPPAWREAMEVTALEPDVLAAIRALGVPAPGVGVDLTDETGRVVLSGGEAELVWREQRVVVTVSAEPPTLEGWNVIPAGEGMLASLKRLLNEGVTDGER